MVAGMNDANRGRLLLLALAAVPACRDDESSVAQQCREAFADYLQCYGSYSDAEIHAYAKMYCDAIEEYASEYGPDCFEAQVEITACISSLGCTISTDDATECHDEHARAKEQCPELIGHCLLITHGSGGGTACSRGGEQCVDGKTYDVTCIDDPATPGMQNCTCEIDGAAAGSYARAGSCADADFDAPAVAECGFPTGAP
jgi:hypothetical protein